MENKMEIPTAEEYYSKTMFPTLFKYKPDEIKLWFETNPDAQQSVNIMIEFAKLHVESALKEASGNATMIWIPYEQEFEINRESILNSYPPENIK